jgi:hypothetical protein
MTTTNKLFLIGFCLGLPAALAGTAATFAALAGIAAVLLVFDFACKRHFNSPSRPLIEAVEELALPSSDLPTTQGERPTLRMLCQRKRQETTWKREKPALRLVWNGGAK